MKRLISILCIIAMILMFMTVCISSAEVNSKYIVSDIEGGDKTITDTYCYGYIGDADCSDSITVRDATTIQKHVANLLELRDTNAILADVDFSDNINIKDATTIQKWVVGLPVNIPIYHLLTDVNDDMEHVHAYKYETCLDGNYIYYACACGEVYVSNGTYSDGEFAYVKPYVELLNDYKKLIEYRLSDKFNGSLAFLENINFSSTYKEVTSNLGDLYYRWEDMILELPNSSETNCSEDFGYILYDINNDSIPELFWVRNDHSIAALFTYINDSVVLLDSFWSRYRCYGYKDRYLYCSGSSGASDNSFYAYELTSDGTLIQKYGFSSKSDWINNAVNFYEFVDGINTSISLERYYELLDLYSYHKISDFWCALPICPLN